MTRITRSTLPTGPSRPGAERLSEFEAMYGGGRHPFDYDQRAIEGLRHERVADAARRLGGGPVLDLGCGLGHISARLRGQGRVLVAMDLSPTAVLRARARLAGGGGAPPLLAGSALELPLAAASFALVVASDGLVSWHLSPEQRAAALREIVRVLRPGGHALLTEYLRPRQWPEFVAEVASSGLQVARVSGIHDRPWYWFESWIRALHGARVGRALRGSRVLARLLVAAGRPLGARGCRHVLVVACKMVATASAGG